MRRRAPESVEGQRSPWCTSSGRSGGEGRIGVGVTDRADQVGTPRTTRVSSHHDPATASPRRVVGLGGHRRGVSHNVGAHPEPPRADRPCGRARLPIRGGGGASALRGTTAPARSPSMTAAWKAAGPRRRPIRSTATRRCAQLGRRPQLVVQTVGRVGWHRQHQPVGGAVHGPGGVVLQVDDVTAVYDVLDAIGTSSVDWTIPLAPA